MFRLRGGHDDRQVALRLNLLQPRHHLESIQPRHQEVQQDERIAILAVQLTDFPGVRRRAHRLVARPRQHLLQQRNVRRLIVHDQNPSLENIGGADHYAFPVRAGISWRPVVDFFGGLP